MDDQRRAWDYHDPAGTRMLGIAADVLRSFGSGIGGHHLAIVGGLAPVLLVPEPPSGLDLHVGTGDIDLMLSIQLMEGETAEYYRSIVEGLRGLGLHPDEDDGRTILWRWVGRHRGAAVQVELLCPVRRRGGVPERPSAGTPAEVNVGPNGEITALALWLGHLVLEDTVIVERRVETVHGSLTYPFPVAGLAAWLCLKWDAITRRDKPKDAYDVVWVVDALGPVVAARRIAESALLTGRFADEVRGGLSRLVGDQFRDVDSVGPRSYAGFFGDSGVDRRRRHALGTMNEFRSQLEALRVVARTPWTGSTPV